jgi:hypothetical protein
LVLYCHLMSRVIQTEKCLSKLLPATIMELYHMVTIGRQRKLTANINNVAAHLNIHQHSRRHGDGAIMAYGLPWMVPHHTQHHTSCRIPVSVTFVMLVLLTASKYDPPTLPQPNSHVSWLAIVGGECCCWSNIHGILSVPFQWLILYTALF